MNKPREIAFIVDGHPIPKARARVILQPGRRAHAFTPRSTKEWEATISLSAKLAMALEGYRQPFLGPVAVEVAFYRKDHTRADLDNFAKSVLDPLNGVVWKDDAQVVELHSYKRLDAGRPRVEVRIRELEEE